MRERVNEFERDGRWLLMADKAREKKEESGSSACVAGGIEDGARMNWVI